MFVQLLQIVRKKSNHQWSFCANMIITVSHVKIWCNYYTKLADSAACNHSQQQQLLVMQADFAAAKRGKLFGHPGDTKIVIKFLSQHQN